MHFDLQRGMTREIRIKPCEKTIGCKQVGTVAIMGADYPGVRFDLAVSEGEEVRAGQTICVDRQRPDICFVASASGRVSRIQLGARRRLEVLEITVEGDEPQRFSTTARHDDALALRQLLLKSGIWASIRTRPFGIIPDPKATPAAIFVTATAANQQAPDPVAVIAREMEAFQIGARALLNLTSGNVFVCQRPGPPLVATRDRLEIVTFSGPYPSGMAGPQIHRILPASRQREVWEINYEDVLAIGHLSQTGRARTTRSLCLSGPGLGTAVEVIAPMGAKLTDLVEGLRDTDEVRFLSGPALTGQQVPFLRRRDLQVTAIQTGVPLDIAQPFWHRLFDALPAAPIGATLPMEAFERAFPFDILPVPLMRALAIGDFETAERLGCLELVEEDLALLSWLCPSGADYGMLLRRAFDTLTEERAA